MSKTPLKKIIKSKIKSNKELSEAEILREKIKYEIADELGLKDKVDQYGWWYNDKKKENVKDTNK